MHYVQSTAISGHDVFEVLQEALSKNIAEHGKANLTCLVLTSLIEVLQARPSLMAGLTYHVNHPDSV